MEKKDNELKIYYEQIKGIIWRSDNIQRHFLRRRNVLKGGDDHP